MNFRPLGNKVLIERVAAKEFSKGGIIIPGNAQEAPVEGFVRAAGPGKLEAMTGDPVNDIPRRMPVAVGDRVLFGKFAGSEVQLNGEKYVLMDADDILGVITED